MKTNIIAAFENGDTLFPYFSPATRYISDDGAKIPLIVFLIHLLDEKHTDPKIFIKQKAIITGLINSRDKYGKFNIDINNHVKTRLGLNNYKAIDAALIKGRADIARAILDRKDLSLTDPVTLIKGHGECYIMPFAFAVDYCPEIAKEMIDRELIDTSNPVYVSAFSKFNARQYACNNLKDKASEILENDLPF